MGQPGGSHGRKPRDPTQPYRQQNAYHRDGRQHQPPAAKEWCIPRVSAEFVAHMEDVLDLYAEPYDPQWPVGCFDETSTQLPAETRPHYRPSRDALGGRITSTGGRARATCSWHVSR